MRVSTALKTTLTAAAMMIMLVISNVRAETFPVVEPPTCLNNLGEPVAFVNRTGMPSPVAAGMARRDEAGQPTVYRFNFDQSPPAFQQFVDRHECAHHQTGDVGRPHPPRNSPEHLMNESIADCVAILRIRDEGGAEGLRFEAVAEALANAMRSVGFPDISVDSRISNIRHCHDNYGTAEDFIDGVLTERGLQ